MEKFESVIYDGRRRSERTLRKPFHCTACGGKLPRVRRQWGLVWDSNLHGICVECLHTIRSQIGYKYRELD